MKAVLVTGAGGFVGARVVKALRRAGIESIIGVGRSPVGPEGLDHYVCCDLAKEFDLKAKLAQASAVIHLAARVHVMHEQAVDPAKAFHHANVEATARLAAQAASAGVERFIFASTIKVNGERTYGRQFTANDLSAPEDEYARSKAMAEVELAKIAVESNTMSSTILRPPLIYGARASANFAALMRLTAHVPVLPFGAIHNRRSFIHVDNFAEALVTAALNPQQPGSNKIYMICDAVPVSTPDLVRALANGMGRRPILIPVPVAWLRAFGAAVGKSAAVSRLTDDLETACDAFAADFDWKPHYGPIEGLKQAGAAWVRVRAVGEQRSAVAPPHVAP